MSYPEAAGRFALGPAGDAGGLLALGQATESEGCVAGIDGASARQLTISRAIYLVASQATL